MGWLLACFGCPKKRKRPKRASKFGPKCTKIGSYQPLESDVPDEVDDSQPLSCSNSATGDKPKDEKKTNMRKRVRFNLEVTTYKLLPADDHINSTQSLEFESNNNWEGSEEEEDTSNVFLGYVPLNKPSYASNHRYNNCCEDEDEYHDDDDDDDDDNDVEDELSDPDDEEEDRDEYNSCLIDADKIYHEEIIPEDHHHIISVPVLSGSDGSTLNTRLRSHYVVPVLNPIENLSQWKAVKARKC